MIRVALCAKDEQRRLYMRALVERFSERCGVACLETAQFTTPESYIERCQEQRPGYFDVVVCAFEDGIQHDLPPVQLEQLVQASPGAFLVFSSPNPADAAIAYEHGASFVLQSAGAREFVRVMRRISDQVKRLHGERILVKSKRGVDSLRFEDVLFVETVRGGVVAHLSNDESVLVRTTLQSFFEDLSRDARFAKAGSSFVVNLDNVRSIGDGSVIFADGEAIIVPIRVRKPLKEAYESFLRA